MVTPLPVRDIEVRGRIIKMKCPMHSIDTQWQIDPSLWVDCIKEKCARWDKETKECSELSEEKALRWIARILLDIKNKMPHAGQFLTKP